MAVGETSGDRRPRRVVTAGGGRRRAEMGEPGSSPTVDAANPVEGLVDAPEENRPLVDSNPELERLLAEEEEIERRTRGDHHEAPHFPKDA